MSSYRTADDTFRGEQISGICVCETNDLESVHLLAIRLASSVGIGKRVHASNCIGITDSSIRTVCAMRINIRSSINFNTKSTKIRILKWVRWLQCGTLEATLSVVSPQWKLLQNEHYWMRHKLPFKWQFQWATQHCHSIYVMEGLVKGFFRILNY